MKVKEAKFVEHRPSSIQPVCYSYDGYTMKEKKPDGKHYNIDSSNDPVEAVIALSIGQSVTPRGEIEVKHFKESKYGAVDTIHVSAANPEELREKLHEMVDAYIGYYHDSVNGV